MVKDIIPLTKNNLYREYFEEFYDFSDATNYNMNIGASGITFTGANPDLRVVVRENQAKCLKCQRKGVNRISSY